MAVDYRSPIYLQLREVVRTKIEEGEYAPGTAIPSENELAEAYGINRLTVRNAVDTLVNEGLLKRVQGKGVYVVGAKAERDLESLEGFSQTMHDEGATPSIQVLAKTVRRAGGKYAALFGVDENDELYAIKRLCSADGEPYSLEEILIPRYILPKLEGIDLGVFSLYEVYGFYGVEPKRAQQTMELTKLEQSDARTLGIDNSLAVFLFTCQSYDDKDRLVEFARTYTRADKCNFSVRFAR